MKIIYCTDLVLNQGRILLVINLDVIIKEEKMEHFLKKINHKQGICNTEKEYCLKIYQAVKLLYVISN